MGLNTGMFHTGSFLVAQPLDTVKKWISEFKDCDAIDAGYCAYHGYSELPERTFNDCSIEVYLMRKNNLMCIALIVLLGIVLIWNFTQNKEQISVRSFNNDFQLLKETANFFVELDQDSLYITANEQGEVQVSSHGKIIELRDEYLSEYKMLESLISENKYSVIIKDNNYVEFQRWAMLDKGGGVVYCFDSQIPNMPMLTTLKILNKKDWYYYESDYNEWRISQQNS